MITHWSQAPIVFWMLLHILPQHQQQQTTHAWSACPFSLEPHVHSRSRVKRLGLAVSDDESTLVAQLLDHLWKSDPFTTVEAIMSRALVLETKRSVNDDGSAFIGDEGNPYNFSEYINGFDLLYQGVFVRPPPLYCASQARTRRKCSFRLDLAYFGSDFCGWQRQAQSKKPSVQEIVEDAMQDALGYAVNVRVAGRTDAGVHALGQIGRVRTFPNVTAADLQEILSSASKRHRPDMRWKCWSVVAVDEKFHPTFGTTSRSYLYMIDTTRLENIVPQADSEQLADRMDRKLHHIQGRSLDFVGLSYGKVVTETTHCTLHRAKARVTKVGGSEVLVVELTGDRFLRRMVRILVATALIEVVRQPTDDESLLGIVQSRDRGLAAPPAPAAGLIFLTCDLSQGSKVSATGS